MQKAHLNLKAWLPTRKGRGANGVHVFHWGGPRDWNQTLRHTTLGFVVGAYLLGAAWSLLMLLDDKNYKLLLFGFHIGWIGAVALLLTYRATDRPGFRTILNPKVWAILMILSAAVAFESVTNGYDGAAALSGVIGTFGALAPLAVKALDDMWMQRFLNHAAAASQATDDYPPA